VHEAAYVGTVLAEGDARGSRTAAAVAPRLATCWTIDLVEVSVSTEVVVVVVVVVITVVEVTEMDVGTVNRKVDTSGVTVVVTTVVM
jgi:hypothetical protein